MCVRAGEAKILVSIFKNGTFVEDKIIYVYANAAPSLILNSSGVSLEANNLSPYPEAYKPIDKQIYTLELVTAPATATN